ncbi:cAMP-specific 3',5'-cyclic phosphodiesterase 4A-like isoform X2 [Zerene cesonia]|uniref:cAMP-specific 3',5'-cyclic phosphodiesterase 4A-like isoform X2 n=1 Tax=Zerene cesonia TaxID=33412 RepID=UPI0018E582BF|nr:cAMP-specific 3',5'-cyclic phosphodiesterase 4A-like isoform X2 [Zerene cesonia]
MQQCGFCSMLSGFFRRAMCVGSRRSSSESYYRELGDQDTLKIDDQSVFSDDSEEIVQVEQPRRQVLEPSELDSMARRLVCTGRFLTMHKRRKKRLLTRSLCQEEALLDDLLIGQVKCILQQSVQWKFNAFTLENVSGGRCLPVLCIHLFHMYGLISHFKLDVAKAWRLFSLIEEGYHSTNPYHNSVHAADVTQAMHCFLQQKRIREHLEPLEVMASLLAAIAHDMDHPGVNQPFLIATSNHLAALYQNTSVLENHHWRSAVSCLIESGLLERELRVRLERQVSSMILATDITRQQEYLSQFKTYIDTNTLDLKKSEHRHLVLQIALKCADISNPCRPWEISRKWSLKVCEEFFRQGDYERKLNLPVTALCDRHTTSIPKIQTGFFKFVVTPLITEWHKFLQNDLSAQMLENLKYNQSKWESLVVQEMAEETRTEISDADMVDDDLETCSGTNISDSSEMLLPLRRSSLNPPKPISLREQLRRFSVPLNVFQDSRYKNKSRTGSVAEEQSREQGSAMGSEYSLHSQLSVRGHCEHKEAEEKVLSTEKLLPDSSIASITTPVQATRLKTVLKDGGSWKLVRQQTFPPMEMSGQAQALLCRPLYTSSEDTTYPSSQAAELFDRSKMEGQMCIFLNPEKPEEIAPVDEEEHYEEKENINTSNRSGNGSSRRWEVGSQLRENLSTVSLSMFPTGEMLGRRKSMPADDVYAPKEKRMREVAAAIPEMLRHTLIGKESPTRRRGSAPAPVSASELPGLTALARNGAQSGRRRPAPVSCQQWMKDLPHMNRRSSLPAEGSHPAELSSSDNSV